MIHFIRTTTLILRNELTLSLRNSVWLFFGLFQPLVYLFLFRPFLEGLVNSPGFPTGDTISFFVPGVLIMMAIFNTSFVGFPLIDKLRSGVIERWRVTPVNRLSLLLGMVLRDGVTLLVQCLLLFIVAILMGLRPSWIGVVILLPLLMIIGMTMASISYTLALIFKDEGALAGTTNFFLLPLFMLSGVMLPLDFAPKSIQTIARFNPFTYAVNASRALISGTLQDGSIFLAFVIFIALGSVAFFFTIRAMREATA